MNNALDYRVRSSISKYSVAPPAKASRRVSAFLPVLSASSPWRRERHGEETLNFVEKASSSLTRNFGRRRSWMASLMAFEYEAPEFKAFCEIRPHLYNAR